MLTVTYFDLSRPFLPYIFFNLTFYIKKTFDPSFNSLFTPQQTCPSRNHFNLTFKSSHYLHTSSASRVQLQIFNRLAALLRRLKSNACLTAVCSLFSLPDDLCLKASVLFGLGGESGARSLLFKWVVFGGVFVFDVWALHCNEELDFLNN